jgi:hypothetical protein
MWSHAVWYSEDAEGSSETQAKFIADHMVSHQRRQNSSKIIQTHL